MNEEVNEKLVLLEEHERLNASLAALTRHFAHVQLLLQQVVCAPTTEDREVCKKKHASNETIFLLIVYHFRIYSWNSMNLLQVVFPMSCVNRRCTRMIVAMKN